MPKIYIFDTRKPFNLVTTVHTYMKTTAVLSYRFSSFAIHSKIFLYKVCKMIDKAYLCGVIDSLCNPCFIPSSVFYPPIRIRAICIRVLSQPVLNRRLWGSNVMIENFNMSNCIQKPRFHVSYSKPGYIGHIFA